MFELPTSVTIDDTTIEIRDNGNFRMVFDCFTALQDEELTEQERLLSALLIFYQVDSYEDFLELNLDITKMVKEMYNFFNCGLPEAPGNHSNYALVDWEQDSALIASAVNAVSHTEVRDAKYIHWWTFMGYYTAIGECTFSTVVSIRSKISNGKKLESYENEFKRNNPQYFNWSARTIKQKEADRLAHELWNKS